ncbi:hypothetical protein [Chitinophaga sp.]|uniref:hypothetical protein n=1 Tax=Chitinophaga sp. TaxID=1869181 RepID=UPI0026305A46|nr:hypothetical protein [uncultured Chitinophaga sp.]
MKLITIFGEKTNAVYAIHYNGQHCDELDRLFFLWSDIEYVKSYLQERKDLLAEAFRVGISIEEAAWEIKIEAELMEDELKAHYRNGLLQSLFMPLRKGDAKIYVFQQTKSKSRSRRIWRPKLRIYAIRLAANCYVITGGGIKLTKAMQDCPILMAELTKIKKCVAFLKQHKISEQL